MLFSVREMGGTLFPNTVFGLCRTEVGPDEEKTDFLPPWTRDAPVVMEFNRAWFDQPAFMKNWLENYWKKNFPGKICLQMITY